MSLIRDEDKKASYFRAVYTQMWTDDKFLALSAPKPCGQFLFLYLLTGPQTSILPGLFLAGAGKLADDLHWTANGTANAIRELRQSKMVELDPKNNVIFLPNSIFFNYPSAKNVVVGWKNALARIPNCDLKARALIIWFRVFNERNPEYSIALESIISEEMANAIRPSIRPQLDSNERMPFAGFRRMDRRMDERMVGRMDERIQDIKSSNNVLNSSPTLKEENNLFEIISEPTSKTKPKRRTPTAPQPRLRVVKPELEQAQDAPPEIQAADEVGFDDLSVFENEAENVMENEEDLDSKLYQVIWRSCLEVAKTFGNYGAEGKACKRVVDMIKSKSPGNEIETCKSVVMTFHKMRTSGDKFWASQPFTPMTLASPGLFERIYGQIERQAKNDDVSWINEALKKSGTEYDMPELGMQA